jgi:hypothetical protein
MSKRMRSGSSSRAFRIASIPSLASPQTFQFFLDAKSTNTPRRIRSLSSTIRIRITIGGAPQRTPARRNVTNSVSPPPSRNLRQSYSNLVRGRLTNDYRVRMIASSTPQSYRVVPVDSFLAFAVSYFIMKKEKPARRLALRTDNLSHFTSACCPSSCCLPPS